MKDFLEEQTSNFVKTGIDNYYKSIKMQYDNIEVINQYVPFTAMFQDSFHVMNQVYTFITTGELI